MDQFETLPSWGVSYIWKNSEGTCVVLSLFCKKSLLGHQKVDSSASWLLVGRLGHSGFHVPDSSFVLEESGGETNCELSGWVLPSKYQALGLLPN